MRIERQDPLCLHRSSVTGDAMLVIEETEEIKQVASKTTLWFNILEKLRA